MDVKKLFDRENFILYFGLITIYILVFLRVVFNLNIPIFINLLVFALTAIFSNRQQLICLAISCIPLSATFQYKYAILAVLLVYFFKFNEDVTFKRVLIPILLMMFWEVLHMFFYSSNLKEYFRVFSEIILVGFIMFLPLKKLDYSYVVRFFAASCIGIITIMLIALLKESNFDFSKVFAGGYRLGIIGDNQSYGADFNPNNLGFICNLAIVLLAQLLLSKNGKKTDVALIIVLFVFGLMTLSRTFLVCFALVVLLSIFALGSKIPTKKKFILLGIVIIACVVAVLILYLILPDVVLSFLERFTAADISNGRIGLFKFYNEFLSLSPKYLLFGIGLQDITSKITVITGVSSLMPHNGIQEILVVWGIPGLLLFVWLIVEMFLQVKTKHKIKFINLIPALLVLVYTMFGQLITAGQVLLSLVIVYISLYVKFDVVGEYIEDDDKPARKTIISRIFSYIKHPTKLLSLLNACGFAKLFSDKFCIKFLFHNRVGVWPNLDNPKTFNEKLNWLKLNDRNPIYTTKVDKVKVKDYVAERIGNKYVIPSIAVWDSVDDIDLSIFPDQFVLKCNHAGGVIVCKDKSTFDVENAKKTLRKTLKRDYFYLSRCWPYKNVERKVFAEQYIQNKRGDESELIVYKVFVFNGKSKLIQVIQGDKTAHETIDYFDTKWNLLDLKQNYPNSKVHLEKPKALEEMLKLSNILSDGVPFVRVDWYIANGHLKFSEFTYYSDSGFAKFQPNEWDEKLGAWIKLPIDK